MLQKRPIFVKCTVAKELIVCKKIVLISCIKDIFFKDAIKTYL